MIADDTWHLLRRKMVISLTEGLKIQTLRDLYPLSKVSRCYVYPNLPLDRALFLMSLDHSYSSSDSAALKELFGNLGDSLFVGEDLMERLHTYLEKSQNVISELASILIDSVDKDQAMYEYLLGWVLYGTGLASIKGLEVGRIVPRLIPPDIKEKALTWLKEYYDFK